MDAGKGDHKQQCTGSWRAAINILVHIEGTGWKTRSQAYRGGYTCVVGGRRTAEKWGEGEWRRGSRGSQVESLRGRPRFRFGGFASAAVLASPSSPPVRSAGRGFLRGRPRFFLGGGSEGSPLSSFFSSSGLRWDAGTEDQRAV